jgi:hypothetical protein
MPGRLADRPGFVPYELKGLWKREQRLYFLLSLACQPNPDQERARRLLDRADGWESDRLGASQPRAALPDGIMS